MSEAQLPSEAAQSRENASSDATSIAGPSDPSAAASAAAAAATAAAAPSPTSSPQAPAADRPLIERLASALVSTARGVRGRWFFVGWTADGLPAASTTVEDLSESARRDLANFRGARLAPRQVPYATLIPVSYVMTGSAIDFADSAERRAEDQVAFAVVDAAGRSRDIAIGEISLLGAIAAGREPWQSHLGSTATQLAVDAVPLYTVLCTLPGLRADTGLALLFESTIPGSSNEAAFRSFVRHSIGRLLMLDESQPPSSRKGYLEVAGRIAGVPPKSGMLGSLVWMRKAGLVDFEDGWLQGMQRRGRSMKGGVIRALRGMGMVEVSDATLAEISDSRPDYDVDQLELNRMLDMADEMQNRAAAYLAPPRPPTDKQRGRR
jgi:hypothetical protein